MGKVFISYRREDAAGYARAIYEELTERFTADRIFMDVDAIEPGLPFDEVIRNAVGQCEALLVLIGARWLAPQPDGKTRLEDERDFVRLEIAAALARNIRVIPVLLDGTPMPKEAELPEALRGLVWRNAIEVSNTRFTSDVDRLAQVLAKVLDGPTVARAPDVAPAGPAAAESARTAADQRTPPSATPAAQQAPGAAGADATRSSAGSGSGLRYVAGVAALAVVAVLAWMMWPAASPPAQGPAQGPAQWPAQGPAQDEQAALDAVRRLGLPADAELDARTAVDFAGRPWGVVFGSDRTLEAARDELRRASRNGVEQTAIYLRNGYYASIALRADRAEAERILRMVRAFRSDAYVADMRTWCLRPQPLAGYVACGAPPAN